MDKYQLHIGDALTILKTMPDQSVQCCVTSPPYWGLRDYGVEGQLGLEKTPEEYVAKMVDIFREVRRVMRDDGTLWLNIGDSYTSMLRSGRDESPGVGAKQKMCRVKTSVVWHAGDGSKFKWTLPGGQKPKDLVGIPWMVAFALRADGWYLRQDIIWHKPNCMPESVKDRCTKNHEYIFLMSKNERYYYDYKAIEEPAKGWNGSRFDTGKTFVHQLERCQIRSNGKWSDEDKQSSGRRIVDNVKAARAAGGPHDSPFGESRNKRSVWTITTKPFCGAHFAVFPPDLIEPCILAGCPEGGIVLDPFTGSGTTGEVALKHFRRFIGIELNPIYANEIALPRIAREATKPKQMALIV